MSKQRILLSLAAACLYGACTASAATITLSGTITQDTNDVGSPALVNTALNAIMDGDQFTVVLNFIGNIASPGTFSTSSMTFSDASAAAQEAAFIFGDINVSPSAGFDQFSGLGCLIDVASCFAGNQLTLEFQIPTGLLTSAPVTVQSIPALLPMDLLEDGGATDIQGTLSTYSYSAPVPSVPEPSAFAMLMLASAGLFLARRNR